VKLKLIEEIIEFVSFICLLVAAVYGLSHRAYENPYYTLTLIVLAILSPTPFKVYFRVKDWILIKNGNDNLKKEGQVNDQFG